MSTIEMFEPVVKDMRAEAVFSIAFMKCWITAAPLH